ncbi:MAG: thiol reductant ABC exporter subunit CydC [Dehalococcoidia bacterium]|nr:thiol reductant ABC exporter subunit CydC [Dehalococcoidia bacterium]
MLKMKIANLFVLRNISRDRMSILWLGTYLRCYRGQLILATLLGLLSYCCALGLMFTSGYLISKAGTRPENILYLMLPVVMTRCFGIARPTFRYLERLFNHNVVLRMTSKLRAILYRALEAKSLSIRNMHRTGDILSILSDDIEHLQNFYLRIIFPFIVSLLLFVVVVVVLGAFSLALALLMLVLLVVMIIVVPLLSYAINGARLVKQQEIRHELYTSLTDAVLGMRDLLYSGRSESFISSYEQTDDCSRFHLSRSRSFSRRRDFTWQLFSLAILCVLLIWSNMLVINNRIEVNYIAAFVLAVFPLIEAFAPLPEASGNIPLYEDSVKRLSTLEVPQPASTIALSSFNLTAGVTIEFKQVSFHYQPEKEILHDINLHIANGEKIAILGASGTGKSTLSALIRGDVTPSSGEVLLNGVSSSHFGHEISSIVGVLNQKPYLFDTTIGNNISLGSPHASRQELEAAIEQSGLRELIETLPHGLDTAVEEAGARFSGGERQRIALARIMLKNTPVVILDEPTVGLDPRTEAKLIRTILSGFSQTTLLWITHHLRGMEQMDRIVFLENSHIIMDGTHSQLWAKYEHYRTLYQMDSFQNML